MARLKLYPVAAPATGLNKRHPASLIEDTASPDAKNVRVEAGIMFKRLGYGTLTTGSVASGVVSGVTSLPMLAHDFPRLGGTVTAMLATCGQLYKWTGSAWVLIKSGLNGTIDGFHSATVMNDTWIYTNNVDHVQVWTGTGNASDLLGGSDYQTGNYHICRAVISFFDRLLLLGTNEDGTAYPYRVRWGELGKTSEWKESEGGGYYDLVEDPSGIQGAELLGNWVVIYCGQSIWLGMYVGGIVVNSFNRVVPNMGCRAPRTVIDLGGEHVFMGEDDVYRFNGGSNPLGVGEAIRDELYGGVARKHHRRCFAALERERKLYHLYVPYGNSAGNITRAYIYDYEAGTWTIDTTPHLTCAAALQMGGRLTIDDLPHLPIDQMNPDKTIDELGGQEERNLMIFCDSAGHVYQDDGLHIDDAGTAVDGYWDSKDLTLDPEYVHSYKRIEEIVFEAKGDTVDVYYSIDQGANWTSAGTQTMTDTYARYVLPIDVTTRVIRVRFRNDNSGERFWLRYFGLRYMVEADR